MNPHRNIQAKRRRRRRRVRFNIWHKPSAWTKLVSRMREKVSRTPMADIRRKSIELEERMRAMRGFRFVLIRERK